MGLIYRMPARLALASRAVLLQHAFYPTSLSSPGSGGLYVQQTLALSSQSQPPRKLNFEDHKAIFAEQSSSNLIRSWLVFRACGTKLLQANADRLLALSRNTLGVGLTNWVVKKTFFGHFCAGETDDEVLAKTRVLQRQGIGSILDFAAEDDVSQASNKQQTPAEPIHSIGTSTSTPAPAGGAAPDAAPHATTSPATGQPILVADKAVARQYSYANEQQCDAHVRIFLSSIESASRMPGQGFTAVKLTGLGNPLLLERVSSAVKEVRTAFIQWDTDGSGTIDVQEFNRAYSSLLPDATDEERARVFKWMDTQHQGRIDIVGWCQRLSLSKMPEYAARMKQAGASDQSEQSQEGKVWRQSLLSTSLTQEEVGLVKAIRRRLHQLADAAAAGGVKMMVDAEHTYFQPAIDHLTLELMRKYNTGPAGRAVVFNTYQAYLKDSHARLVLDLERARREGYILGAKLVRGAYLELERARAQSMGYPSPVWDTLQETHDNYDKCMQELLQKTAEGRAEVLLGTHNQRSVESAVSVMSDLRLDPPTSHVYFGQLLGMSDHLTQVLGAAGYRAYKYVPYGRVDQVIPYLLRRASENASIMQGTKRDLQLLSAELRRRAGAVFNRAS